MKFHEHLFSRRQVVPCGRTDMTKLLVSFENLCERAKNDLLNSY